MKRLFLASFGLSAFPPLINRNPKTVNVGFIPTAADHYQDKWFVEQSRKYLSDQGFKIIVVDIKDESQLKKLNDVDVIFIAGGNTFYLLEKAIESHALELIRKLVNDGKIYVGCSAGAVLAGPSIEPVSLLDDPGEAPNLETYESLGLVDFIVLPHFGKEKYLERYKKIKEKFINSKFKLITLSDEQAIVVEGNSYRIIESK